MAELSNVWRERAQITRKLRSTVAMTFCLFMARTFGEYVHTVWNGEFDYAVYKWRGKTWAVPTTAFDAQ